MKVIAVVGLILLSSIAPANAKLMPTTPNLRGWICIDYKGTHHSWEAAFDGNTFCKLIKNPALTK